MPVVNYISQVGVSMASYRYRIANVIGYLPEELRTEVTRRPQQNASLYVVSKHFNHDAAYAALETGKPVVMDVCDNHFETGKHGEYYKRMCREAKMVTCNTAAMREVIQKHAPDAIVRVIPEGYEMPEMTPSRYLHNPPKLMWFGHPSNLDTLEDIQIPGIINIVTQTKDEQIGRVRYFNYSPHAVIGVAGISDAVIIPTSEEDNRKKYKSANRLVEALRIGKHVLCSPHPSHTEFANFVWIGDIVEGCKWLVQNAEEAREKIFKGQEYIRERFSPESVAIRWANVFKEVLNAPGA